MCEANFFSLASHLFWGTWSVLQAHYSQIDFDFLEYAELRFAEYHKQKASRLQATASFLAQ
eukprot:scaffold674_cov371-Prasinococcus_capsulatus_cf.AAC.8